jgi:hypothetical protein
LGNATKQTTTGNDQGQSLFPLVAVGRYVLEIESPGFRPYNRPYKKIGVVMVVTANAGLLHGFNTSPSRVS